MNEENLTPFKKGNPGGPGRPKGLRNVKTRLLELLELPITKNLKDNDGNIIGQDTRSQYDWILLTHLKKASSGDMTAIKEIYERIDGKVAQTNILQGDEEGGAMKHEYQFKNLSKEQIDALVRIRAEG